MANDSVFYSIGEMARLSGLPAKTLRYYDDIGLLSPARRQGSGDYRFYTREQLEQVLLLQSLKSLGMSLRQIRQEFDQMSSVRYEELLKNNAAALEKQIGELTVRRNNLLSWISDVDEALSAEKGKCYIRSYSEVEGYLYDVRITSRTELELAMRTVEQRFGHGMHVGRIARMISTQDFLDENYLDYSGLFIPRTSASVHTFPLTAIPGGTYAVTFAAALHEESVPIWRKLRDFAAAQGYRISGNAYRSIPVEVGISKKENDYVAKYYFPVAPVVP